eukprot:Nk52_evm22s222 gene=Nk52_evmTU22s222
MQWNPQTLLTVAVLILLVCPLNLISSAHAFPASWPWSHYSNSKDVRNVLKSLQINKGQSYSSPLSPEKLKGVFPSYVHLYTRESSLRNDIEFFDNNMFVTNWVTQIMLEASEFDSSFSDNEVKKGTEVCTLFHDRSDVNYETAKMNFWEMKPVSKGSGHYRAWPMNIFQPIQDANSFIDFVNEKFNLTFPEIKSAMFDAFGIPADFDDTSVNLVLGALLKEKKDEFPKSEKIFSSTKFSISSNTDRLKATMKLYSKYAYKPYATIYTDPKEAFKGNNLIDPRTYYWIHAFLHDKNNGLDANQKSEWAFITTWIQNTDELVNGGFKEHYAMPFNTNNVDGSVNANSILGITRSVFAYLDTAHEWFDDEVMNVYLNSVKLVAWLLNEKNTIKTRPDLIFVYYPPVCDFYWFVSRTVYFLRNNIGSSDMNKLSEKQQLTLKNAYGTLKNAMENGGTELLLESSKMVHGKYRVWDEFLGNDDYLFKHHDDRLFATAVSTNALLDTWTYKDSNGKYEFVNEASKEIREAIAGSVSFLRKEILRNNYKKENAFFSGSMKGLNSLPFSYPSNFDYLMASKGLKKINPEQEQNQDLCTPENISTVQGVIGKEEYNEMLKQKWYGSTTPTTFAGFASTNIPFPYWSSPSMTYAVTMLVMVKTEALHLNTEL